ncbi:MAG: carboxymuconolactone decarboxylase family protein [Pseudonocardiaceae bacterium]
MNTEQPRPSFRAKPPTEVVRDALAMATRKRREGCDPCVDAYLNLARKNGATDEEIAAAVHNDKPRS